jgi:hypothetical protein
VRIPNARVAILANAPGRVRIAVQRDEAIVFGWVAAQDLNRDTPLTLADLGTPSPSNGPLHLVAGRAKALEQLRCASEVRLAAEIDGARTFVGTLAPQTILRVVERTETFARVAFAWAVWSALWPAHGASFLVPARDLASCPSEPITSDGPGLSSLGSPPSTPARPAPIGAVSLGAIATSVPMPDAERVVRTKLPHARACYNAGLKVDPTQKGEVTLVLRVQPSGDVLSGNVSANTGVSAAVAACIVMTMRNVAFVAPGASGATVTFTLAMAVAGD